MQTKRSGEPGENNFHAMGDGNCSGWPKHPNSKGEGGGTGWGILLCKLACWRDHVDDDDYGDDGDDDGPKWQ